MGRSSKFDVVFCAVSTELFSDEGIDGVREAGGR